MNADLISVGFKTINVDEYAVIMPKVHCDNAPNVL
jgi:hypothetical protein